MHSYMQKEVVSVFMRQPLFVWQSYKYMFLFLWFADAVAKEYSVFRAGR